MYTLLSEILKCKKSKSCSILNLSILWCCFLFITLSAIVALHVTVNEFYQAEIEEWEKAISHWQSNPGHLWLELPVLCTFLYFCLITSKFISSVRQDALSIYSKKKLFSMGSFLMKRIFHQPLTVFWRWLLGVRLRQSVPSVQCT